MDWTGGIRRRYAATRNNAVVQKQKAHFAKANLPPGDSPGQVTEWRIPSFVDPNGGRRSTTQMHPGSRRSEDPEVDRRGHQRSSHLSQKVGHERSRSARKREMLNMERHTDVAPQVHAGHEVSRSASRDCDFHSGAVIDEEMMLLANRRKLLAQSDWLKLAPTKPLRMKFPVAGERDRVGRRRKISKSGSQKAKPAQWRLITPIFEDRLPLVDAHMSGAQQGDDNKIKIRIGTDAFASQTAASRKSSEAGNSHGRPLTRRQYAQSEDSMLLGVDGDVFDADQVEIQQRSTRRAHADLGGSVYAQAGSQMAVPRFADLISSTAVSRQGGQRHEEVMEPPHLMPAFEQQDPVAQSQTVPVQDSNANVIPPRDSLQEIVAGVLQLQSELQDQSHIGSRPHDSESSDDVQWRSMLGLPSCHDDAASRLALVSSSEHDATSITDIRPHVAGALQHCQHSAITDSPKADTVESAPETRWKDMLGLRKPHLSQLSGRAVHSDSVHEDTSSSTKHPGVHRLVVEVPYSGESIPTPCGVGTNMLAPTLYETRGDDRGGRDTALCQSPSASLQQIRASAAHSGKAAPLEAGSSRLVDYGDADAMWRRFVVGSQSSEASGSWDEDLGDRHLDAYGEFFEVNTLGSDTPIATTGDLQRTSLSVTGRTSSVVPLSNKAPAASPDYATVRQGGEPHSSMEVERGDIEDADAYAQTTGRPKNIHAASPTTVLNPRRFKREAAVRPQ
ncbi:hypothetical protein LTR95_003217, partial [Oleoguttula sp. CCFEE 5521]